MLCLQMPGPTRLLIQLHMHQMTGPCLCRDKLLAAPHQRQRVNGGAFTLSVARQSNIAVVITRAAKPDSTNSSAESFARCAEQAATAAGYLFEASTRAQRGLSRI